LARGEEDEEVFEMVAVGEVSITKIEKEISKRGERT
tara:strand:+ start:428 stop:535 length:108 start_codon:yes stop_codon:yes gene_type:complete